MYLLLSVFINISLSETETDFSALPTDAGESSLQRLFSPASVGHAPRPRCNFTATHPRALGDNVTDGKHAVLHRKLYIVSRKKHAVQPVGIVVVLRTRIVSKHAERAAALILREPFEKALGKIHFERIRADLVRKAAQCLRTAVRIRKVRLYIDDRRHIHKIGTGYGEHGTERVRILDSLKLHRGKSERIRAKRRASSEHAEFFVSSEARRTDRKRMLAVRNGGNASYQPQMRELLYPADGIRICESRLEHDPRAQTVHDAALSRDAELGRKIRPDVSDRAYRIFF